MTKQADLWEVRKLDAGPVLELHASDAPAVVLTQGENRVRMQLTHVKGLVAALDGLLFVIILMLAGLPVIVSTKAR